MPLGEPDPGQVPPDGPRHPIDRLLDHFYLTSASLEQGVEHRTILSQPSGSEHDHADDGRYLPRLFGLLRVNQHRGHETIHLCRLERPLPHSDGNSVEERP